MRIVKKPWGHEEIWAETPHYVGKVLFILAGKRLSLQYHREKVETVRVMQGVLRLTCTDSSGKISEREVNTGDSFHIPAGHIHRFAAGENSVVLVEVSTTQLDDVVRIEDDYARTT